jgi:3-deoxy-D-manno-octulosonic-acid transferase
LLFYRALGAVALAAYAPYALLRSLAGGRRLGDIRGRLGRSAYPDLDGGIWIHAVSVGEIGVAHNLLRALRKARPGCRAGISVTTAAGRELAERTMSQDASLFAFPFDLAGPVERALAATRPGLVLLTETEIWPLFLERAARRGVPVALVNGRISERSYRRYRCVRGFLRGVLGRIALFAMQSGEDARRVKELGADGPRVRVAGNIKYDMPPAPAFADIERLRAVAAGRPVVVAGSTGEGEEALVLQAWSGLENRPLLVLAPRRPERFDEVARLCESRGLRLMRRSTHNSQLTTHNPPADIYLLDSIGELASVYRGAALAFVGGSLIPRGGQNPIEAWAAGVPVLAGPHMENFRDVATAGQERGILRRVENAGGLARELAAALAAPEETRRRAADAERFVAQNRGAADRTAEAILTLLPDPAAKGMRA